MLFTTYFAPNGKWDKKSTFDRFTGAVNVRKEGKLLPKRMNLQGWQIRSLIVFYPGKILACH